jgi:hypothetical protein
MTDEQLPETWRPLPLLRVRNAPPGTEVLVLCFKQLHPS